MDALNVALPAVLGAETEPASFDLLRVSSLLHDKDCSCMRFTNFNCLLYDSHLS